MLLRFRFRVEGSCVVLGCTLKPPYTYLLKDTYRGITESQYGAVFRVQARFRV